MTAAVLAVQRDVPCTPELTASFEGVEASREACNSLLVETLLIADRLCAGTSLMVDGVYTIPTIAADGASPLQPQVGQYLSRAVLTGDDERTIAALALARVCQRVGASAGSRVYTDRSGGVVFSPISLVVAGVVIAVAAIAGVGMNWYARNASSSAQTERLRLARIVEGGRLTSERYAEAARTGRPVAPPSELEVAVQGDMREAAAEARANGFGQIAETVRETVSGVGKVVGVAALAAVVVAVLNASRGK